MLIVLKTGQYETFKYIVNSVQNDETECKLSQLGTVELRRKKKSHLRKVTGFQVILN